MAIVDYNVEGSKLVNKIFEEVSKMKGCYVQDLISYPVGSKEHGIQVSTCSPTEVGDVIEAVINKSKYGQVIRVETHEGQFDWASNTYIKDSVTVEFKLA